MPTKTSAAAEMPDDLRGKKTALAAVKAEAEREQADDNRVVVTLKTRLGFHDMRVPSMDEWTAVARHAANRNDSLTWAQYTLSTEDTMAWMRLNPTLKDETEFWDDYGRALGQSLGEGSGSANS